MGSPSKLPSKLMHFSSFSDVIKYTVKVTLPLYVIFSSSAYLSFIDGAAVAKSIFSAFE